MPDQSTWLLNGRESVNGTLNLWAGKDPFAENIQHFIYLLKNPKRWQVLFNPGKEDNWAIELSLCNPQESLLQLISVLAIYLSQITNLGKNKQE